MQRYIDELRLLHAIRLAVLATDLEGVVTFANDTAADVYAGTRESLVGRDLVGLLAPPEPDRLCRALEQVLAGATWRGDMPVRRLDGWPFLAAISATPIRDERDVIVGAVVVAEDMTEIRQAEAEAAASQQRLRLAHEAAQLGSWHWDLAAGTNVWDEQLEAIFGLPKGGFDGTFEAWEAMLHPDDHDEVMAAVQAAIDARSSYVLRNRVVWPDGTVRWIEAHGKVTTDEQGNPTGTIGCVRDVTERVEVQEAQADAAARARLLQEVTADFGRAWTLEQVADVLAASLERVSAIIGEGVELVVPRALTGVSGSDVFVASAEHPIDAEDLQLLDTLASQCAIAAQRAELLGRTSEIAEQLQSSLAASPLPDLEHFELAVHYAPGGDELEHVGGDWYDAVRTADGSLALVVGDVMGRGVGAATTMIRIRAGIRGLLTVDPAPQAVLTAADDLMARDAPDQFVTAAAALVDPERGRITLCNAGHVPVVVVHTDGRSELVGAGAGMPLGIVQGLERATEDHPVGPGATVVLVTDGVVESREADLDRGIERLRQRASDLHGRPLEELVAGIAALADGSLRDDVTVVAARLR